MYLQGQGHEGEAREILGARRFRLRQEGGRLHDDAVQAEEESKYKQTYKYKQTNKQGLIVREIPV